MQRDKLLKHQLLSLLGMTTEFGQTDVNDDTFHSLIFLGAPLYGQNILSGLSGGNRYSMPLFF